MNSGLDTTSAATMSDSDTIYSVGSDYACSGWMPREPPPPCPVKAPALPARTVHLATLPTARPRRRWPAKFTCQSVH